MIVPSDWLISTGRQARPRTPQKRTREQKDALNAKERKPSGRHRQRVHVGQDRWISYAEVKARAEAENAKK